MSLETSLLRLLTLEIRAEHDAVLCRQRARQLAAAFGFDNQGQTHIGVAVSEIARNAYEHARGGRVEFAVETARRKLGRSRESQQSLVITVRDQGPGLPPTPKTPGAAGEKRAGDGSGLGLAGARRLMDSLEIDSSPARGATITMRKGFPPQAAPLTAPQLQAAVERIAAQPPANPLEELQFQNQELLRTMDEVRAKQDDLERVNQELADTNSGVMALYDELETLHRVSVLLASQISLQALLQAIIDATTELTGATFGAFFLRHEQDSGAWLLPATGGPARAALNELPASFDADFFGPNFGQEGPTFALEPDGAIGDRCAANLAEALRGRFALKSCLTVPVASSDAVLGALVFGGAEAGAFNERSERIVTSIAAQAVVGIEKARLFESVQSASAAKDRFLATLSHELRTPLNPVLAIISSLTDDDRLPPDVRQDLGVALSNTRLEAKLIDDLLDFSRIINGKLQLHKEALDLHTLIRGVIDICQGDIVTANHRLVVALDAPQSVVFGDSARLQQIFWNVLKNAIKFTPESGCITVRSHVTEDGASVCVTITDSGRGIDAETLPRIFGAFEQGGPTVPMQYGGMGMGLAIAKAFVDLHEGRIFAESEGVGRGATISVCLPLLQGKTLSAAMPASPESAKDAAQPTGTILLVDDHADTLRSLERLLARRGHRVLTAQSGAAAAEIARAEALDLIISDLGLPDGSGLELLPRLRALGRRTPAIALSGYGMEEDIAQTRAAGYDEHLTKPVDFARLMRTISELLARGEAASGPAA